MAMTITKTGTEWVLTVALEGRLDAAEAPRLEAELGELGGTGQLIVIDMAGLASISSAGLRVLMGAQKATRRAGGNMVVRNANQEIMELLEAIWLNDILKMELS